MTLEQVIALLQEHASPQAVQGMARFDISSARTLGVSIPVLRRIAKDIGRDHPLALEMWRSGIHEARILASMIADPRLVSPEQMEEWVLPLDMVDNSTSSCKHISVGLLSAFDYSGRPLHPIRPRAPLLASSPSHLLLFCERLLASFTLKL